MFNALLADFSVPGSVEQFVAFAVLAVAGGLILGYLLGGLFAWAPERQELAPEDLGKPLYAVVLHNDDFNTFGFVIGVLGKVFAYGGLQGFRHAFKVHCSGRGVLWSGTLEVAELKADQVRSCGADPKGRTGVQPLKVSVEPLPG
jgi:ATP-dependent Clp protease adaptor protein ClpS